MPIVVDTNSLIRLALTMLSLNQFLIGSLTEKEN